MTDIPSILPHYTPTNTRLLTLFQTHLLTTADLLCLDPTDISRRCTNKKHPNLSPPLLEIKRFVTDLAAALSSDTPILSGTALSTAQSFITTGDERIDTLLSGGVPTGTITEFVGESGTGKTQFLLTLTLTAQLSSDRRSAIYISTESPLSTPRLLQIAASLNARHHATPPVSTDRVLSITCNDLETQDHILRYQLPVAVARHDVGIVVIDSIAANFRAEFDRPDAKRIKSSSPAQMARRGGELVGVAQGLRELARRHNLAVVVANQVSDRFGGRERDMDPLALDLQSRWFTGWDCADGGKVPALGLVWANLLGGRVVLRKSEEGGRGRRVGVVFAGWAEGGTEIEYEIWEGGVRGVAPKEEQED